jgi:hypothetical protein
MKKIDPRATQEMSTLFGFRHTSAKNPVARHSGDKDEGDVPHTATLALIAGQGS